MNTWIFKIWTLVWNYRRYPSHLDWMNTTLLATQLFVCLCHPPEALRFGHWCFCHHAAFDMHLSKMAFSKAIRQPYYDVMWNIFRNIIIFPFSGFKEQIAKVQKMFYITLWYDYLINVEKAISHNFFFFFEYSLARNRLYMTFHHFWKAIIGTIHIEHSLPNQYSKMREMCETRLRLSHSMHFIPFRRLFSVDYIDLKVTVLLA